jgi:hypothetical protein
MRKTAKDELRKMEADKKKRLIQLLGMIGSAHDGEALNAARLAQQLIGSLELSWEDVLSPGSGSISQADMQTLFDAGFRKGHDDGYRRGLAEGHARSGPQARAPGTSFVSWVRGLRDVYNDDLTNWEQGFIESFLSRGWPAPTPKQRSVFERIADKLGMECPV